MNVAIVGAGMRAREAVIPALNSMDNMNLAVICDIWDENIEKALPVANNKPEIVKDYTSLLNRADIDGIILITPNYLHAEMAEVILKSGKPLYLEKPMGISVSDCNRIMKCADETGTPMMVGMQLRYSDCYTKMKALLDEGKIGELRMMNYTMLRTPFRGGWENWRLDKKRSGGSIIEVSIHHLDLFNWFCGRENARISAFGGNEVIYQDIEMNDNMMIILEYDNGVRANIEASLFTPVRIERNGLYLIGTKGVMYTLGNKIYIVYADHSPTEEVDTTGLADVDVLGLQGFYDLVKNGEKPLTTAKAGKMAVVAALAAQKSIETGRAVDFAEILGE